MSSWGPIRYREFWDVPRIFLVTQVFDNEPVDIVSIGVNTFVIFPFSHKQPESFRVPKITELTRILSYTGNVTQMLHTGSET